MNGVNAQQRLLRLVKCVGGCRYKVSEALVISQLVHLLFLVISSSKGYKSHYKVHRAMDHTLYDMSESPIDIGGVSLWGPGQALSAAIYKTSGSASTASTPNTPPYSQTLDLERRMLDISSVALIPPACLHTTVIAGSRQPVCTAPVPVSLVSPFKSRARGKNFVDPCDIAPLKKRRIQVDMLTTDERDKVLHKREKNKVAAEKCRVKRREKVQQTRSEYEDYLDANESMEAEIRKLTEEKVMLQELLDNHNCVLNIKVEV